MDTQQLIDEACPVINRIGWASFFAPGTVARGERLGLDVFSFYFLGRGGVLGDVESDVVASAFGYFQPTLLGTLWDSGRAKLAPREAAREYFEAAHEYGRESLAGIVELDGFVRSATMVVEAARSRADGLVLFAGAAAEPVPGDLPAAAMHQLYVLRELRGSAHLLAVVASGLETRVAHFMRRPEMFAMFGWPEEATPVVTDLDVAALAWADEMTDRIVAPAFGSLDDQGASSLLAGLGAIAPRIDAAQIPGT